MDEDGLLPLPFPPSALLGCDGASGTLGLLGVGAGGVEDAAGLPVFIWSIGATVDSESGVSEEPLLP